MPAEPFRRLIAVLSLTLAAGCTPTGSPSPEPTGEPSTASPAKTAPATTSNSEEPGKAANEESPIPFYRPLSDQEVADGWISLFDGHTLFGWESSQPEINWHVDAEAIVADEGPAGLLTTKVPFADFELRAEFRMEADGNSGIFVRTPRNPTDPTTDCYEVNIADTHPDGFLTGSLVGRQKTEAPLTGSGEWKQMIIRAEGPKIQVTVDETLVLDYTEESETAPRAGYIGLQKRVGKIEFRKLVLRPLGMQSLFNGTDLTGWREVPGSKSEFTVEEGVIRVRNGLGFLETVDTFGNFLLQYDAKTHANDLNSGLFFRAMPGTEEAPSNGYEVQIHNGIVDDDPTQPANGGTGGIFRRVEARRVVSRDNEWFRTTLVANGPHIAVWVDGYQVVQWEDTREPDENPRRGLRTAPGHLSLQGHDPTTDLSFRSFAVAPLPE